MSRMHLRLFGTAMLMGLLASIGGCSRDAQSDAPHASGPQPPIAAARPYEVPSPHGARQDEFYWLRDDTRSDKDVLAYLEAENAYADAVLAHTKPLQEKIYNEIVSRIQQDDSSVPYRKNGYWYYRRYETGKEYPIYARKRGSLDAPEEIMLDVNRMAEGHSYFQVANWEVSPNGKLLAWAEDNVGRRQYTIRIKDLTTGKVFDDKITNADPGIAWAADNRTLLYVAKDPTTLLGDKVRKHVLGTDPANDPLVYEEQDKSYYTGVGTTKDEQFLVIFSQSTVATQMQVARSNDAKLAFKPLIPRERDHEYYAEHLGDRWIIRTNWQAKNFRIVSVPEAEVSNRDRWRDVIPHRDDAFIDDFAVFKSFLAVQEHSNGLSNIRIAPWDGKRERIIRSDEASYTATLGTNAELDTNVVRYVHMSLVTPPTTYDYDTQTDQRTLLKREPVLGGFDQTQYTTEFIWVTARDGVKIPVSLAYRKTTPRNGTAPLLQYGYGAYGLSMDPFFSHSIISLLDRGFIYAIAHIRGGQEMGRDWYENGKLLNKRNTFSDFIDVTKHLVAEKYADPKRVFGQGGSAGGLLIGAVANIAPELYRGLIAEVPFVDIVTTMLDESIPLTSNEYDEWGNPQDKQFYEYMLSYSPYDNVRAQAYPAMYVSTGLWDSQVQYFEPAKWVAKLRKMKTDDNPLVFRINMEAGHGGKSGRFQRYREIAEEYGFLLDLAGIRE
ncbi:MAG TPA: S9 family peptidase [Steroidobacteraceae bacterium]